MIKRIQNKAGKHSLVPGISALAISLIILGGCTGPKNNSTNLFGTKKPAVKKSVYINNKTKFSAKEFGVVGSPRMTSVKRPRKGGGRYQVGKPYKIRGKWYKPKEDPNYKQVGLASWYGPNFHGRLTANGEIYDQYSLSAAHPTMPLPSYARVTNLENGRSVVVRVNDRGPYAHNRVIDLSAKAAELLGYTKKGVAKVKVEYAGKARMDGLDEQKLLASYVGPDAPSIGSGFGGTGTLIAMNEMPTINRPEAAINSDFGSSNVTLSGNIPVPTVRPTLFEGIPIITAQANGSLESRIEQVVYRPKAPTQNLGAPRPIGYFEDQSQMDRYAFTLKTIALPYLGESAQKDVVISVGMIPDAAGQQFLQNLIGKEYDLRVAKNGWVEIAVHEQHVNQLLDYLQEIGLKAAYIR